VQGRPDDIISKEVREFMSSRPTLRIIPIPPDSQSLNKAEPNIRRLGAFALANAVCASLDWDHSWEDMQRGAELQYQLGVIRGPSGKLATRYSALTGRLFDLTTVAGCPGQLIWYFNPGGHPGTGNPVCSSGYYICPD
jgi:hypothetical protein